MLRLSAEARRIAAEAAENARLAALSPAQRAAEEARAAKEAAAEAARQAKFNERYWRAQDRKAANIDHAARRAGNAKGNDIGLDTQVDHQRRAQIA